MHTNTSIQREEQYVELPGRVTEVLPAAMFRVAIQGTDGNVLAHLAGRLRHNRIRVVLNDRVTVAVSVYDPRRGRIVYRH
jgi:translation initiation factor IF-1